MDMGSSCLNEIFDVKLVTIYARFRRSHDLAISPVHRTGETRYGGYELHGF